MAIKGPDGRVVVDEVEWKRETLGQWVAEVDVGNKDKYVLTVKVQADGEFWSAAVIWNGSLIHVSEHESRHDAIEAAVQATARAVDFRRDYA